ncbi:MAG TPA: carboxypeptidase regulatory-like domain-containing protein [Gemmatimonadaceae bacterium]|nr:carboxypeptidase regulatory-like domain-containing protein [Gemmatimonadaceae bacterium]
MPASSPPATSRRSRPRQSRSAHRAAALALLTIALPALELAAQSMRGVVRDADGGHPIPLVELQLMEQGRLFGQSVRSDTAGRFSLPIPPVGTYTLRARRVGYIPLVTGALPSVGLAGLDVAVELTAAPAELADTVTVTAPPFHPLMAGFEERRRLGLGTFITREQLEKRGGATLPELLREIPGIAVAYSPRTRASARSIRSATGRGCSAVVFLDGTRMNGAEDSPQFVRLVMESITANTIEAIEIYKDRAELPPQFGHPEVRCGAIVVWTRRGRSPSR